MTPRPGVSLEVVSVGFAPVKGTRHIRRPEAQFDAEGPVGDRRYCLVDVERRQVLKTVQHPSLIGVTAELRGEELAMSLPDGRSACAVPATDGEVLTCDYWKRKTDLSLTDGPHAALLSTWLGRHVRLARAPRGDVVFGAPVSIVTTASLGDLTDRAARPGLVDEAARFRATFVVDTDVPFAEEAWQGREVGLVDSGLGEIRVRIGAPIPRCAVMDLDPVTGERNARLLRALAGYRPTNEVGEPLFGVYAEIDSRSELR
ncbi:MULTISPECIES: MOSC domain-containing protein [unclassified Brevibacterium]|uniref:MOSC domain-containing protein n=1 Tax=unclassified Brevibacterium TaxID=2614124 RepID=UPI0010822346|nr:MOSC N-terminal beta barrel domain-containing protein [Brevibacterium sp. S111]TGD13118.1 MOSC domain-containing protein [Brevibacterium sp. S111]